MDLGVYDRLLAGGADDDGHAGPKRGGRACREFKLPTLAAETVGRFSEAGHAAALPTLVEVLEQEAEDRRIRRVDTTVTLKTPACVCGEELPHYCACAIWEDLGSHDVQGARRNGNCHPVGAGFPRGI